MSRLVLGDALHFSISQLKSWLRCPRFFEFRYVRGLQPEFTPMNLAFGSAFHATLAHMYTALKERGAVPTLEEAQQHLFEEWKKGGSQAVPLQAEEDEKIGWDDLLDLGFRMLVPMRELVAGVDPKAVVAVEQPFVVDVNHPDTGEVLDEKLVGVIDLVLEEEGHRVVVEHKTAARKFTADQVRFDLQPAAYGFAAGKLGWGEVGLRFQVVTKTKVPTVQVEDLRRDGDDVSDFLRTTVGVLKAVDAGISFPLRGWQCRTCQYRAACGARR